MANVEDGFASYIAWAWAGRLRPSGLVTVQYARAVEAAV
jgi:hypothetical protein